MPFAVRKAIFFELKKPYLNPPDDKEFGKALKIKFYFINRIYDCKPALLLP
ncbi:hypothetical protein MUGA111182_08340 [Mucilaginibacter galii]